MGRRRGRDRVVGLPATGGRLFRDLPNGELPRSTYRDYEPLSGRNAADAPVYPYRARIVGPRYLLTPSSRRLGIPRFKLPSYAKQILRSVSWRANLNRMPSRVKFCLARKSRREVLFAMGRAGFGGSAPKKHYRRTSNSNYGC